MNKKKTLLIIIIIILAMIVSYSIFKYSNSLEQKVENNTYASINEYAIYGIHFRIKGSITLDEEVDDLKLVLKNNNEETELSTIYTNKDNTYTFKNSEYINEGLNLEKLKITKSYLLIKTTTSNKTKYYTLKNDTEYNNLEYYTITNNNKNNKINVNWLSLKDKPFLEFQVKKESLPDNVYDITIDPGHDSTDPGTVGCLDGSIPSSSGYCVNNDAIYENDMNLKVSQVLKEKLTSMGYKVIMTRNSESDTVNIYDPYGSATMANDTHSKFNIAIHHNSSGMGGENSLKGLELYIANDTNTDLAEMFINNITKEASTWTSPKMKYKIGNGIYERFFEEYEIDDKHTYWNTSMIYYYYIREVGGISTHAAQNIARNGYPKNEHYNSNNTAEPYLFELGYLDNYSDLHNLIDNREKYASAIANAIQEYLTNED